MGVADRTLDVTAWSMCDDSDALGGSMAAMTGTTTYAGFWRRVAAWILDGLLLSLVTLPFTFRMGGDDAAFSAASTISTVVGWLYFALMESSAKQATVGKMALGIIVTDLEGGRIRFSRATGRYFAKILSALILGIGFLMVAFTERKQGLHDMVASTLVVKGEAPSQPRSVSGPIPPLPPPPPTYSG
jgi:uncharacterized RDD family membrane protein YckC